MILTRTQIRDRDKLANSVVLAVPELGPDAEVRLCPMPASVQLAMGAMDDDARKLKAFALVIAGSLCDDAGNRLYSTSEEDLAAIQDDMPWPALVKIANAAMEVSGLTEESAGAIEKN